MQQLCTTQMECARQLCVGQWLSLANFSWKANRAEQVNICNFGLQAEPGPLQLEGKPRCEQLNILISGNRLSLAHCSWKANLAATLNILISGDRLSLANCSWKANRAASRVKYFNLAIWQCQRSGSILRYDLWTACGIYALDCPGYTQICGINDVMRFDTIDCVVSRVRVCFSC